MTLSSTGGSGNRTNKIDRVRNLLAFDLSLSSTAPCDQVSQPSTSGRIPVPFDDAAMNFAEHVPSLRLVGFDEAGRGALAGPVTVACVSFEPSLLLSATGGIRESIIETYSNLNDSKRVTERNRERLYPLILEEARWGIGCASVFEIDRLGIVKACCIAASRAYRCLLGHGPSSKVELGLFDRGLGLNEGDGVKSIPVSMQLTHGDARSFHIAAASILAKVRRDAIMRELEKRSPVYGFDRHKGYGTAAHFAAIQSNGPSRLHRHTFLTRM